LLRRSNGELEKYSEFLGETSGKSVSHLIPDEFYYWELKICGVLCVPLPHKVPLQAASILYLFKEKLH